MRYPSPIQRTRRHFLREAVVFSTIGMTLKGTVQATPPPQVDNPRATDGDDRYEPDWKERLTITVGIGEGDLRGDSDRVIQAGLDYVARAGGGTVQVLPGTYTLRSAIVLPSQVCLRGSGADTILTKIPSETVTLSDDSDWYDREIRLSKSADFRVGDSALLRAINPHDGGPTVIKRRLVARDGLRFKLDDGLRENLWISGKPTCSSLFPLLTSERTSDVLIENITLDGNQANNENLNGNYGGCIFLQDCNRYTMRDVIARNYNGDGISFQICHDVLVENCHCHDNTDLGLHPGSGSQRPIMRNNLLERNSQGIFWCWGVKFGLAEANRLVGNRLYGMSIGHNDTDNTIRGNTILESGKVGILFREEGGGIDFWPHRNTVEQNRIENSGQEEGIAIDIQGKVKDVRIVENQLLESRGPAKRTGIRIGKDVGEIELKSNELTGFAKDLTDQRTG